jgi:hypothetical protein
VGAVGIVLGCWAIASDFNTGLGAFVLTPAPTTGASGTCPAGWSGTPRRNCGSDGFWSAQTQNCTRTCDATLALHVVCADVLCVGGCVNSRDSLPEPNQRHGRGVGAVAVGHGGARLVHSRLDRQPVASVQSGRLVGIY